MRKIICNQRNEIMKNAITKTSTKRLIKLYEKAIAEKWDYQRLFDNDIEHGLCLAYVCAGRRIYISMTNKDREIISNAHTKNSAYYYFMTPKQVEQFALPSKLRLGQDSLGDQNW